MAFTKAKIVMAGLAVTAVCIVAPQQLKAQVPEAQMDGVMGQSIEDETEIYTLSLHDALPICMSQSRIWIH